MPENYEVRREEGRVTVVLPEKVVYPVSGEFRGVIDKIVTTGEKNILLDFSHVKFFDSKALSGLLTAQNYLKKHQGELRIINVEDEYMQRFFKTIQIDRAVTYH